MTSIIKCIVDYVKFMWEIYLIVAIISINILRNIFLVTFKRNGELITTKDIIVMVVQDSYTVARQTWWWV